MVKHGDFSANFARPPSYEREPFKVLERILFWNCQSGSQFRCRQWKFTSHLDKPFFSFHNLQSKMRLSNIRKLNSSAIEKCAMVFVPPLAIWKVRNRVVLLTPLRHRQCRKDILCAIYKCAEYSSRLLQVKNNRRLTKKVYSAIGNLYRMFPSRICESLYDVKPKAQSERGACALLGIGNWVPNCQLLYKMAL
jgi:hypothetical protein